jgi:phenylalanyl-tRNA synthetase beta chain
MRTSLWPGLLKALSYNQKRQRPRVRLFEHGLNFVPTDNGLQQDGYLGGVVAGAALPEQWGTPVRPVDFFDLKADVEALLVLTGEPEAFRFVAAPHPALHPGQSARIERSGELMVGWLGTLHPASGAGHWMSRAMPSRSSCGCLLLQAGTCVPSFWELSKFPVSRRDIAIVVDEVVTAQADIPGLHSRARWSIIA